MLFLHTCGSFRKCITTVGLIPHLPRQPGIGLGALAVPGTCCGRSERYSARRSPTRFLILEPKVRISEISLAVSASAIADAKLGRDLARCHHARVSAQLAIHRSQQIEVFEPRNERHEVDVGERIAFAKQPRTPCCEVLFHRVEELLECGNGLEHVGRLHALLVAGFVSSAPVRIAGVAKTRVCRCSSVIPSRSRNIAEKLISRVASNMPSSINLLHSRIRARWKGSAGASRGVGMQQARREGVGRRSAEAERKRADLTLGGSQSCLHRTV